MSKLVLFLVIIFVAASRQQATKVANETSNVETGNLVRVSNYQYVRTRNCPPCVCGIMRSSRIVGGVEVENANRYPWIASLQIGWASCGGSLINSRYILTAAHCVASYTPNQQIVITLMEHDMMSKSESNVIVRHGSHVIRHADFTGSGNNMDSDIALIRMDREVELGIGPGTPTPACLPKIVDQTLNGMNGIVIGWGLTAENGSQPMVLRKVTVPIISNEQCRMTLPITSNMLCAGYQEGGKDACQGDSGGPMMVHTDLKYVQVGIVSFGIGCARQNTPGVYTKVSKFLNWIAKYTTDACYCSD